MMDVGGRLISLKDCGNRGFQCSFLNKAALSQLHEPAVVDVINACVSATIILGRVVCNLLIKITSR
jgi:hypothetical protein